MYVQHTCIFLTSGQYSIRVNQGLLRIDQREETEYCLRFLLFVIHYLTVQSVKI